MDPDPIKTTGSGTATLAWIPLLSIQEVYRLFREEWESKLLLVH